MAASLTTVPDVSVRGAGAAEVLENLEALREQLCLVRLRGGGQLDDVHVHGTSWRGDSASLQQTETGQIALRHIVEILIVLQGKAVRSGQLLSAAGHCQQTARG